MGFHILTSIGHCLQDAMGEWKFLGTSGLKEHEPNKLYKPEDIP